MTWRCRRATACALLAVALRVAPAAAAQGEAPEPYVKRPAWGAVVGYVIDAESRLPIRGAVVSTQADGEFAEEDPGTAQTDAAGRYQLRAPLGSKESSTKISPLVIFGDPIRKRETNTIDVTQLNVRVTCAGYRPFMGAAVIRHAAISQFRVYLAEILLAREGSGRVSFAPTNFRWEYLEDFTVSPEVADRGAKLTMTARLRVRREPSINYELYAIAPAKLVEQSNELPLISQEAIERIAIQLRPTKPAEGEDEQREFVAAARVRPKSPLDHGLVHVVVFRGTENVTSADARPVLIQAPRSDEERKAAELCREGYSLYQRGELHGAVERVEAAAQAAPEYCFAHELRAELYLKANRPEDAVEALRRVAELDPDDAEEATYPKLAEALVAAGRPKEGVDLLTPLDKDPQKRKDRTESKMSPRFNVALARCYLALGDFAAADSRLKRAGLLSPELRQELATERASAMLAATPDELDAHAGLARALADAGRWDEAVTEFRAAAGDSGADAWQYTDLAGALMEGLESYEEALPWAQRAVADDPNNPEARLRLGECYRHLGKYEQAAAEYAAAAEQRPTDFYARHWHGLMLLWQGKDDEGAQELLAALQLAREKGEHRPSFFGLFVPIATTRILVHGFRYPEADQDYIVLDALSTVRATHSSAQEPAQLLAKLNMAAAFVELGLPDAALPLLRECLSADPEHTEALYLSARAHIAKGDSQSAEEELQRVVQANPLHPEAYLDLAKLRLEVGDAAAAQRYVLQHRRNYPEEAPRQPKAEPSEAEEAGEAY